MQLFYQFIYHPFVNFFLRNALKFLHILGIKMKIHPSGIISVPLISGHVLQLKTNQTCHVTHVLFWEGSSGYEYSDIFQKIFPHIQGFMDIGANIGYYSIMAGVVNPTLKVFAFDPSPGPFHYLEQNIRLNRLSHVKAFQMAVSNENGSFSFHVAKSIKYNYLKFNTLGGSGHLSHVRENQTKNQITVKAQKLDDFVEEKQIVHVDLIKIDVEEAEHLVLEGAHHTILKFRPIIVCEVFSTPMWNQIRNQIIAHGFSVFLHKDGVLLPTEIENQTNIEAIENYFFVPSEKMNLISLFIKS